MILLQARHVQTIASQYDQKLSYRQLQHWDKTALFQPSERDRGYRFYTFEDLFVVITIVLLRNRMSIQAMGDVIENLRAQIRGCPYPLAETLLRLDKREMLLIHVGTLPEDFDGCQSRLPRMFYHSRSNMIEVDGRGLLYRLQSIKLA